MLSVMMHRSENNAASERSFLGRWDARGVVGLASTAAGLWSRSFVCSLQAAAGWVVQAGESGSDELSSHLEVLPSDRQRIFVLGYRCLIDRFICSSSRNLAEEESCYPESSDSWSELQPECLWVGKEEGLKMQTRRSFSPSSS